MNVNLTESLGVEWKIYMVIQFQLLIKICDSFIPNDINNIKTKKEKHGSIYQSTNH